MPITDFLSRQRSWLASAALAATLAACGGTDYDPIPDTISIAGFEYNPIDAGTTNGVGGGTGISVKALVVRTGNISNGDLSYAWTQKSGPTVALNNAATSEVGFTAPAISDKQTIVLNVRVSAHGKSEDREATVVVKP